MNNKEIGTAFEDRVCEMLSNHGYWAHFITPDERGAQPFDVIAVKDGIAYAIECKTLSRSQKWFPISRLEENQILAFYLWEKCKNTPPLIFIEWGDELVIVPYYELRKKQKINMLEAKKGEMECLQKF